MKIRYLIPLAAVGIAGAVAVQNLHFGESPREQRWREADEVRQERWKEADKVRQERWKEAN